MSERIANDQQCQRRQIRGGRGGKKDKAKGLKQKSIRQAQDLKNKKGIQPKSAMK